MVKITKRRVTCNEDPKHTSFLYTPQNTFIDASFHQPNNIPNNISANARISARNMPTTAPGPLIYHAKSKTTSISGVAKRANHAPAFCEPIVSIFINNKKQKNA